MIAVKMAQCYTGEKRVMKAVIALFSAASLFFFSSRRRHTRLQGWSSDVCSSDLGLHRAEIAFADHREAGFDHVHLQAGELARDFEFFAQVHGGAGALLTIAERGVEYDDAIVFHGDRKSVV